MAISIVQTPAPSSGATNTFASAVTAGNSVILGIGAFAFSNAAITSSAPLLGGSSVTGSSQLVAELSPFSTGSGVVYYAFYLLPNIPGGATSVAVTVGGGGTAFGLWAWEVSGLGSSPTLDQSAKNGNGNSLNPSVGPSGAITAAPELVLGAGIMLGVALASPGAPWTVEAGGSNFAWAGYQIATSSGGTYTWSQSSGGSANAWSAVIATVEGTSGGSGATGIPAPLALAAPAGSLAIAQPGAVSPLALAAPAGSLAIAQPGAVSPLALAAPAGSVQAGAKATGIPAPLALAAPGGTVQAGAVATGLPAGLTLAAPPGTVTTGAGVTGLPAGLAFAAPPGVVHAGATVAGATAALQLAAPPGTVTAGGGLVPLDPDLVGGVITENVLGGSITESVLAAAITTDVYGGSIS